MGFRLDAIKHMDRRFLLAFVSRSTLLTSKAHIFLSLRPHDKCKDERICSLSRNTGLGSPYNTTLFLVSIVYLTLTASVKLVLPYIKTFEGLVRNHIVIMSSN